MNAIPLEKNQRIRLFIEDMNSDGQGVGRAFGFAVFVVGALPGETVLAHIIKVQKNFAAARLAAIITPSLYRTAPRCLIHESCGGCGLQYADYALQKLIKRNRVISAFERIGCFKGIEINDAIGMDDPWRYRNKGAFPIRASDGAVRAGLFARRSNTLVPVEDCVIQNQSCAAVLRITESWASIHGVSAYDSQTKGGILRHVITRTSTLGEIMVCIAGSKPTVPHLDKLADMLSKELPAITSILLNVQEKPSNVIFGKETSIIYGNPYINERICGLDVRVSLHSFLQVNSLQREVLYSFVRKLAGHGNCAVELYCGIGSLILSLSKSFVHVYGVECVQSAVSDARQCAERNNITNAEFILGFSEDEYPKLSASIGSADLIVLNPPRKGCDERLLKVLDSDKIIYISCNPATLARDCSILSGNGYSIATVQPIDMFPHTPHIETIVEMRRSEA